MFNGSSENRDIHLFVSMQELHDIPDYKEYYSISSGVYNGITTDYVDNTGDNISKHNKYFAEYSKFYWIWKNLKPQGIIGFCQYRRYLWLNNPDYRYLEKTFETLDDVKDELNPIGVGDLLQDADIIMSAPFCMPFQTVEEQYRAASCQRASDWDLMKEVLLQIYPEYEKDFYRFAKSHYIYCVYGFENEDMPKECKSLVEMLKLHIEQFCKKCQKVYVYGAGIYGRLLLKMSKTLQEKFGGWIETNSNCSIIDGFPIKSVKEMGCINNEDIGVLVAIKDKSIQKACLHAIGQWNVKKLVMMRLRRVKMKELTVGMPLCNEGRYLRETLESLLRNYQYIDRIILSDNCSDDDTATICKEYEKKYDKIDYFRQEKRLGLWENWRVPLAMTDTKYFMWLCGHDLISDNFMKEMLCQLRQNPDAVAGISMVYMFYNDITNQRIHLNPLYSLTTSPDVKQRVNAVLSNWHHSVLLNQIIRTSVLKEMPEMDQVASDQILAFYVALKGRMVYSTNAEYFYRENKREIESFTKKKSRYESWKLEYKEINALGYLPNQFWEMCKKNVPEFSNGWLYDTISQQCRINRDADFDDDTFILRHKRGAMEKRINGLGRRNVIFGTGKEAETLYGALAGRVEICGFADNNPQRQQGSFMGLKVWAPAELKDNRENIFVLVAMGNFYREISEQLSVLGFQYWDDFCYWGEIASWHELCGVPHHDTCARFDIFD